MENRVVLQYPGRLADNKKDSPPATEKPKWVRESALKEYIGKDVFLELTNGKIFPAVIHRDLQFEIVAEANGKKVTFLKHSILAVWEGAP